jgi:hypothetical protein
VSGIKGRGRIPGIAIPIVIVRYPLRILTPRKADEELVPVHKEPIRSPIGELPAGGIRTGGEPIGGINRRGCRKAPDRQKENGKKEEIKEAETHKHLPSQERYKIVFG